MTIARTIFVSIVSVGLAVTLSRVSLGHEEHREAQHDEHHGDHHDEHHGDHHDEHHGDHHDEHHGDHHEDHHGEHHEDHHGEHHDEHPDWRHDEHHGEHHDESHAHDTHPWIDQKDWYRHEWWHHQLSWHNRPWQHWWHHPTINEIAAWSAAWRLAAPVYYHYGPGGNVVYRNNSVYVNGGLVGTTNAYTKSVIALANTSKATNATNDPPDEWLPLGTFAVLRADGGNEPSQTLQLAIDKNRNISGVLFDLSQDISTPIHGSLDRATQRVAFDLGPKSGLVAETGIYNLTKDEVTMLVHKENKKPETYTLIRFQSPPTGAKTEDLGLLSR